MHDIIKSLSTIDVILWGAALAILIFHLFYSWIVHWKLLFFKESPKEEETSLPPVSVIICAKNEARNLEKYLHLVLEQDYPEFQVVVVNDCSEDDSQDILVALQQKYSHLHVTVVKEDPIYRHGKKLAVLLGIKAAKYDHFMFTDADCYPASKEWLKTMASHFSNEVSIVLGVSPHEDRKKGLLGDVIGYETLKTAMSYVSSALRKRTYMGVGRNMGYTKQIFYQNKGFQGHTHILSGDDDLFVNKAATKNNVAVEFSANAIVPTLPEKYWKPWFKQKRRHMSTGKYYQTKHKLRFVFEKASIIVFYLLLLILAFIGDYPFVLLGLFIFYYLNNAIIRAIAAKKLKCSKSYFVQSLWLSPIVALTRDFLLLSNLIKPQKFTWR